MTQGAAPPAAPSPVEIAWLAGIYEGEGTAYIHERRDTKSKSRYATLAVISTDRWVCERVQNLLGEGKVYGPYRRTPQAGTHRRNSNLWKDSYQWRLHKIDGVTRVLGLLYPHLSPRRQKQATEALAADTRLA